jgi:uncharacterized protein (TIGR00251 family)
MPLLIEVKVVPSSGRYGWVLDKNGKLKCYLKSAPERGKANAEFIVSLAKILKIPQRDVTIIAGDLSRVKKIKIEGTMTIVQLLAKLGIEQQMALL